MRQRTHTGDDDRSMGATVTGVGIGRGIAVGPVVRLAIAFDEPGIDPSEHGAAVEAARARTSLAAVAAELRLRGARAGGAAKHVLDAQATMTEDPALESELGLRLGGGLTAERAVFEAFASLAARLRAVGGYIAERGNDLDDVSRRVVAHLQGRAAAGVPNPGHPYVLVAHDLAPADTVELDLTQVLAFVTVEGGPTSHTAILAREKSIVAVVGATDAAALVTGTSVLVDAGLGEIMIEPDAATVRAAEERAAPRTTSANAPLDSYAAPGMETGAGPGASSDAMPRGALADGTRVPLLANLGSPDDAAEALRQGAEGVGLFRTEFLYLDAVVAPTVEAQCEQYGTLFAAFSGKTVVVRVLDAGTDKPLAFLGAGSGAGAGREPNPALGSRGIRALRAAEHVLVDQLTALAEADAATDADVRVMAPMVTTVEEARYFVDLCREHRLTSVGVMIETPAAALIADRLLAHADFTSLGTNDLTQYTMAADRQLGALAQLQDPWHPAVLRLIASVGAAGRERRTPVGICGEAAADPLLAVVLVGLGATSLSMAPSAFADVRAELARHSLADAERIARAALDADGATEALMAARQASVASRR